ncbi:hypothetical protein GCM10011584_31130 [Nocardioides phosphati]|uniref:DUF2157 domain-containing protein n=1 Tax=Nocardioides phosphati TaxID=1867775 RepID=A0ABQ2NIP7_9ACTN|nr:hypothetical protein [Nocardioides phosphati]GGO93133.1 hypothetical protein GCM10011584_31130 [Nocardioides phosphati]
MFLYADPTACPRCRTALQPGSTDCTRCRARLDDTAAYDVFVALQQVDRLVTRLVERPAVAPTEVAAATPAAVPLAEAPPAREAARSAMSGLTVPKVLLGLGALCLVVAALVFLVVAWAALGVGGRTAVLVGFTVVAGGLAAWSARSGLRAGAESMTTVALGLLLLDLAGARSSGWFGDLGASGFALLAGSVVTLVGAAATLATRRTTEPRLLSAEVAASGGIVAALAGLQGTVTFSDAAWMLTCLAVTAVLALAGRRLRLGLPTWTAVALTAMAWVGLAGIGAVRSVSHPSWAELADHVRIWPLLVAALLAAAPATVRRLPVDARAAGAAVSTFLLTLLVAVPGLDEGVVLVVLVLVAVVAAHAAAGWLLPRPWRQVSTAPLALAGCTTALAAAAAALGSVSTSPLLTHGLWDATATEMIAPDRMDAVWALLMPLTAAATAVAVVTLVRLVSATSGRALVTPAVACVLASCAFCPVIVGAPRWTVVAVLLLVAAGLLAWALRRSAPVSGLVAVPLVALAFASALADDGLTVTVLILLTAVLAAAGTPAAPRWARTSSPWLLPASVAATVWSVASVLEVDGSWRAVPVLAMLAVLAVLRPAVAHEVSGLVIALLAMAVSTGFGQPDLRLVAAELTGLALVATYLGVRHRPGAGLVGLVLLAAGGLAAWPDARTATIVLAVAVGVTVLHELRKVEPAALTARAATPVALGALLWTVAGLAGLHAAWQGVPVVVALGALAVWRPDPVRETPAALVATWAAVAALAPLAEPQGWTAVYLTLGGVALTAASLLHPTRRMAAWAGLALLTLATWLRLQQLGVGTVEAYTLPLAAVLLVVGTVALLRGDRSSLQTQGAGLGLALVPSLLQALAEPLALRAALLGIGCVLLIALGIGRRWAAPLLAGGATLALLVLRQMTIAQAIPQWALIAAAGVLLTFLGLTWEQRLANVRTAAGYVRGLR